MITEMALPRGLAPGRHGQVVFKDSPRLGHTDLHDDTGIRHRDSILLISEFQVPDAAFKRHKANALLEVGEHMADL